ncbi:hypothetical protein BV25DRAFT_1790807, partial [Artomyces pyxidatus]
HKLSTISRPPEISWWVQRHRVYEKPPVIKDLKAYGIGFRKWWEGLQPLWRGDSWPLERATPVGEKWTKTRKGGANGFVMVVIALAWWA